MDAGALMNLSPIKFNGSVKFVQEDKAGNLVKDRLYVTTASINSNSGKIFGFFITVNTISFGDRIVGYYSEQGSDIWEKIDYSTHGEIVGEYPLMSSTFIWTKSAYAVGDYFEFRLKNNKDRYAGTVWTVTGPDGVKESYPQSEWEFKLTKAGKYKIDAAVATEVGGTVTEHVVTVITVQ
jgi:hypothetical protein